MVPSWKFTDRVSLWARRHRAKVLCRDRARMRKNWRPNCLKKSMQSKSDTKKKGKVYLVGAGAGDLGLVTLRAKECIERADVIVYDHLANPEMLSWAREEVEIIYAGKKAGEHALNQEEINKLLIEKARAGKEIVRLKGGDPFVLGRGAEEAKAIVDAGLAFEIVPGITSAIAGPASAGIPVTQRADNAHVTS